MASKKRMIDANELLEKLRKNRKPGYGYATAIVGEMPTVDAVEVVHGRWIHHHYDSGEPIDDKWYCSECHMCNDHKRTWYCPNCGAKMDGGN